MDTMERKDLIMYANKDTMFALKMRITYLFDIPVHAQKIMMSAQVITGDVHMLSQYGIGEGTVLHVTDTRVMCIYVSSTLFRTFVVQVPPSLTVGVLTRRLTGIARPRATSFRLTFGKWALMSNRTLSSYGIRREDTVWMHMRFSGGRNAPATYLRPGYNLPPGYWPTSEWEHDADNAVGVPDTWPPQEEPDGFAELALAVRDTSTVKGYR